MRESREAQRRTREKNDRERADYQRQQRANQQRMNQAMQGLAQTMAQASSSGGGGSIAPAILGGAALVAGTVFLGYRSGEGDPGPQHALIGIYGQGGGLATLILAANNLADDTSQFSTFSERGASYLDILFGPGASRGFGSLFTSSLGLGFAGSLGFAVGSTGPQPQDSWWVGMRPQARLMLARIAVKPQLLLVDGADEVGQGIGIHGGLQPFYGGLISPYVMAGGTGYVAPYEGFSGPTLTVGNTFNFLGLWGVYSKFRHSLFIDVEAEYEWETGAARFGLQLGANTLFPVMDANGRMK